MPNIETMADHATLDIQTNKDGQLVYTLTTHTEYGTDALINRILRPLEIDIETAKAAKVFTKDGQNANDNSRSFNDGTRFD
jgi:homoserine trans-succinylase